jgi:signal transduction histidine kinase/CheY-like chemotaxis protein
MNKWRSDLKFQILTPIVIFFILVLSVSVTIIYNLQVKLANLESHSALNLQLNNAVIDFNHIRSLSKERLLLYILTGDPTFSKSLKAIEEKRDEKEKKLFVFFEAHPYFNKDSKIFKKTHLQTKRLRDQIVEKVKNNNKEMALQYFSVFSSLFDINSARLTDINNRLETELSSSRIETKAFYSGLIFFAVFLMGFGTLLIVLTLRFHQNNVLDPLKRLNRGLRELNKGNFPNLAYNERSPLEIKEMLYDFNTTSNTLQEIKTKLLDANKSALQSAKVKSDFLSNMSHEIRTPLNSIIGMGELLAEKQLSKETTQYVSIIVKSGQLLLNLVNDILDFSKLESGKVLLNESAHNIRTIVERISSVMNHSLIEKSLIFDIQISDKTPEYIVCDSLRLEQILLNLLSNAIKFTEIGEIKLYIDVETEKNEDFLIISISDTGIGISDDQLQNLFNRFTQADGSITKKYGGTGLGLAIVKQLVGLMSGRLEAQSTLGLGSHFKIYLPLRPVTEDDFKLQVDDLFKFKKLELKKNVDLLLVDDSKENRLLIKAYLKDYSITIDEAENGKIAFESYKNKKYDLVLMDMQMPLMDGCTATLEIRAYEKTNELKPVPILALSAYALTEEREKSEKAGCNLHLTKPIKKEVLLSSITEFLSPQ